MKSYIKRGFRNKTHLKGYEDLRKLGVKWSKEFPTMKSVDK